MNPIVIVLLLAALGTPSTDREAGQASPVSPMDSRVTIDYRDAPAAGVITTLAAAAGLKVEIVAGSLRPVTITLTNVKLRTAFDAVCDNALCSWLWLAGSDNLKVTPLPSQGSASLPSSVSFSVDDTPANVFRALAAAINVPLTLQATLPGDQVSLNFKNAPTAEVLNMMCNMMQCAWDFDPVRGLRIMPKR